MAREKPAYLAVGGPKAQVARIQQDRGGKNNEIVQSFWQAESYFISIKIYDRLLTKLMRNTFLWFYKFYTYILHKFES